MIRPRYMTQTLAQKCRTTPRSCETKRKESWRRSLRPSSRASTCACTETSSAETGSSARSEEHTSELQSLMRISYAVFCLKKKNQINTHTHCTHLDQLTHPHHTQLFI